ncbi:MAG: hypothetical protein ALECFALPRED_007536 [Alectoria fallacina]|uniref:Major facilitator superfamily (MFS) profile domain-containing protein n=1 Tax=Alectoria fallacina TaxID=1903189 RepID=A0A8H3EGW7_9LECA|nr:MAG: hypothetical protein ALECFALPRED_007536 [Alectoria fallacina]
MGLGVLEPSKLDTAPGTAFIYDDTSRPAQQGPLESRQLKYDRSGPVPVILVPQPSDDPNDPLNWPLWKRDSILVILSILSVIASTLSPLLAANTVTLSLLFQKDFTQMALATGYHLLGVGVAGFLFVASARVWGKRHLYLLGTILIIISSAWGGATGTNYKSLLWARIIQGVGLAPFEALVNASVGDLYFVHERGKRMAVSNLALFGGAFFTPILVGKITHTIGWPWSFYFIAIFCGAMLPFIFFFVPETAFRRDDSLNTDIRGEESTQHSSPPNRNPMYEVHTNENRQSPDSSIPTSFEKDHFSISENRSTSQVPPKVSFARSLFPFNGRKTDESFFLLVLRPLPLFLHPAILWACLIQGALIGWTVMIGVVLAAIFLGPPLWFDEVHTGYMYTGPFIGAVLGFLLAGLLADWSAKIMIRKNKGVFEPEFRIVLVVAQLVFGCAGLYGFGITANNVTKYGWFWPDFFYALEVIGDIAIEAFTCLLIFKNIFSFALTWGAYHWLVQGGILKVFHVIASVQVGICLLSIPMYVLGKKNRALFSRYDVLKMTHLW